MAKKKSIAVLLTLMQKKVSTLKGEERQRTIRVIENQLIQGGVLTAEEVAQEELNFSKFVDTVSKYMEQQQMERDDALQLALKRYPQYKNAYELLN